MRRALLTGALTVLLLTACTAPVMPSGPEPTGPAPEPVPSGVLYGRVLRQDGRAATRSTVGAFQLSDEDKVRTGVAIASLGFFCLVPHFCPDAVPAKVDHDGRYAYPADKVKPVRHVTITARHAAESGQAAGARVVVSFEHDSGTQQRVPDLRYWEPVVDVRRTGDQVAVTWPAFPDGAQYTLWTVTGDGRPQPATAGTRDTHTNLDLRPYEDRPTQVVVVAASTATVDGRQASFAHHTGSVVLPPAGAPPSRGAACRVGDPGGPLVAAAAPCPLTDADLDTNAAVEPACATASGCPNPTRHRVCVDLAGQRPVSLVVYRTPFPADGTTVELSTDGKSFRTAGRAGAAGDGPVHVVTVDPPVTAGLACVRNDRFGFSGAFLNEISVW